MAQIKRPAVREPVPDWWFIGVIAVFFGAPMMLLVGAALFRNPLVITVLRGLFAVSMRWYFRRNKPAEEAHALGVPPPASVPNPVTTAELPIPTAPIPDTSTWVPRGTVEEGHTRAHPLRLESSRSKEAFLEALTTRVPPLDTDLRFTTRIAKQNSDRWMDVDDLGNSARLSLHIDGSTFPRVSTSVGVDGMIKGSLRGCVIDLWVRPSRLNRAVNMVIGLMHAALAFVVLRAAVGSGMNGETYGILGVLAATCYLGIGIATIRAQRRLTTRLVDELVTTVEEAAGSAALTPPEGSDLPPAPNRVMTSTEREVRKAATQVRIRQPSTSAGCLPTAAVFTSAVLLIIGSVTVLGS